MTVAAFVEHANVRIPERADRWLRLVFVTPDMHRIHHSVDVRESLSNYSNTFSWWDRLFGTYVAAPAEGHDGVRFGVHEFSAPRHQWLHWMLIHPFLSPPSGHAREDAVQSTIENRTEAGAGL